MRHEEYYEQMEVDWVTDVRQETSPGHAVEHP